MAVSTPSLASAGCSGAGAGAGAGECGRARAGGFETHGGCSPAEVQMGHSVGASELHRCLSDTSNGNGHGFRPVAPRGK